MSDSLKKYPDIFSELFRSMIKVGEESGTLENVLDVLSVQLEKEKELQGKVKKALIYPVILLIVMMLVGICLAIFVLPQLNTFFKSLNADLPLTTKMILGSGDFLMKYWYFILFGVFVLFSGFTTLTKTKKGKIVLDTVLLRIPFVSNLVIKTNTAALIRSLSSLLSSGVPLIRSLEITSGTVNNFYFRQAMNQASKDIEKGKKLYVAFQPYQNILPFGTTEMIEIGEETGRTSLILKKLAEFYEEEVYDIAEGLSATIEPVMIVLIGLAVGVFAISIIGPLYSTLGAVT
jgi:type IV pilus assembly protein PilC